MTGPAPPGPPDEFHRFAGWELRVHEHRLLVNGEPVKIGRPAFNVLRVLAQAGGRVVSKDDLLRIAWDGRPVEENNLSVQVTTLRRLLGAETIVTVSGVGYRLAATPLAPEPKPAPVPPPVLRSSGPLLFGRDADIAAVSALLAEAPLVSVVGTGGVGKTSLARALWQAQKGAWRDGAHWLDLAALSAGASLLPLVARTLGVDSADAGAPSDDLLLSLAQVQALVVLDNCEHLLAEVQALLGPLLPRTPGLRWLATTQVLLDVDGEAVHRLAPLEVPPAGAAAEQLSASAALALFCERGRRAAPELEFDGARLELAAELCRQLDGLPLAIEMAAARVAALGLQQVHDQIGQRLRLRSSARDAPARQHTLQRTFEWSYGLLSPLEQRVFRRLEPFVGGFTPQMAERLCSAIGDEGPDPTDPWPALDALEALVGKSLVQRSPSQAAGRPDRLHLLESARDYARLQLAETGELDAVRRRHAVVVADLYDTAAYDLERWRDAEWLPRYMPDRRNVCVALAWACGAADSAPPALLARLVTALALLDRFGLAQGELVHYAVPLDVLANAPPVLRAQARSELAWSHFWDGSRSLSGELQQQALAEYETLGDAAGLYVALMRQIRLALGRPERLPEARQWWQRLQQIETRLVPLRSQVTCSLTVSHHFEGERSIEQLQQLYRVAHGAGYDALAAGCRLHIVDVMLHERQFEDAVLTSQRMLRAGEPVLQMRALMHHNLALALVRLGRVDEAREPTRAMLRAGPGSAHLAMDLFAYAAWRAGECADAALLLGRSAHIKQERTLACEPAEAELIADTQQGLREALGEAGLARQIAMGAAMQTADVLRLAQLG